jgi:hypothetical protein
LRKTLKLRYRRVDSYPWDTLKYKRNGGIAKTETLIFRKICMDTEAQKHSQTPEIENWNPEAGEC